jgi:hypothetical protein
MVGIYLVGSFALGAATVHSDVDFLVITGRRSDEDTEHRLRALHRALFDRPSHWARELEGSYAPLHELRRVQSVPSSWLYIDNGSRDLERSTHCNTAIVRRTLYGRGIVLLGAPPRDVVEPVDDVELVAESRRLVGEYRNWLAADWERLDDRWRQPYIVATLCRMLATIAVADVVSKRAALEWALANVDQEWHPLIEQTLAAQPVPFTEFRKPARPDAVEATRQFLDYAVGRAARDW